MSSTGALLKLIVTCIAIVVSLQGHARSISICFPDENFDPVIFVDQDGEAQALARKAIEAMGDTVNFISMPIKRCIEGIKSGAYDGMLPIVALPTNFPVVVFPMKNQIADVAAAIANVRVVVVRRANSDTYWDGVKFSFLDNPVLVRFSFNFIKVKLAGLGVSIDEGSTDELHTLRKLLYKRGDVAVTTKVHADAYMQLDEFRGQLEILPTPFSDNQFYLVFSTAFYKKSATYAETVWANIRQLNTISPLKIR